MIDRHGAKRLNIRQEPEIAEGNLFDVSGFLGAVPYSQGEALVQRKLLIFILSTINFHLEIQGYTSTSFCSVVANSG